MVMDLVVHVLLSLHGRNYLNIKFALSYNPPILNPNANFVHIIS